MQRPEPHATPLRHGIAMAGLIAVGALLAACEPPKPSAKAPAVVPMTSAPKLAEARIDLAKTRPANEALALVVSALEADPGSKEALAMAEQFLTKNRWHLPEITLNHGQKIHRIELAAPSSLWVSLAGEAETTVRWDLETLKIESVLFPAKAPESRSMIFSPNHSAVVVERGGAALLCDAQTLKPIRDLGPPPDFLTPSAVVVFSQDGLLVAHPSFVSEEDHSIVWTLRDATSGEAIRRSDPTKPDQARPLAAWLDRKLLRVLHADGSLMEMPVSPVESIRYTPPKETVQLLHAQFSADGARAMTVKDRGSHEEPEWHVLGIAEGAETAPDAESLLERFPWSRHPGIWSGLLRDRRPPLLEITGITANILTGGHAPFHAESPVTAMATAGDRVVIGGESGDLTVYRMFPLPLARTGAAEAVVPDAKAIAALKRLAESLAGVLYDDSGRTFVRSTGDRRLVAFRECDFDALLKILPSLDFSPLVTFEKSFKPRSAAPESLAPLQDRIEHAFGKPPDSVTRDVRNAFDEADDKAVLTAIKATGGSGPAAAKALELALASTRPEWIDACLTHATNLPLVIRQLAVSRIAWLQDRKSDALAGWPDVFPELKQFRMREDWDGWEQADFSEAFEKLRLCMSEELAAIEVPKDPTPEQRKAVADRLEDPATLKAVGRNRFAKACLKAALAFAAFADEKETTFRLASRARDLGEAPEPCLRAEAMALTALGDYQQAHERWITLITEHPVETQEPGDYAEASYTAFENANPQQAMAILTTGLHRFPNDANFALRAGWVALLTGNAERAYRFLLTGRQIGYPAEKIENATALLAIAAVQTGANEDAAAFYQDLILIDPDWEKPETIESLEWPEELKSSLRQLTW